MTMEPGSPGEQSVAAVVAALDVVPEAGLSRAVAAERLERFGPNELDARARESVLGMVVGAVTEPFVLLLMVAAVGAILLGEVRDGLLILAGLIPIVVADVATEYRGERALDALRDASAPTARVRRDGVVEEVAAAVLVPGDLVLLATGDVVPADLRLTRAERLLVDTSSMTGESVPELGSAEPDAAGSPLGDRRAMAFAGSAVVGGRGAGLVVATGRQTEIGRIAGGLGSKQRRRSAVQLELDRLVRILLLVAIALIATVSGLGFLRGQPLATNLLAGISAAIAAIPEEPPILLAVILGLGALRLLRRGVLVRRLNAEEVLGAVDLILTDKTGTLTRNRLEVTSVIDSEGEVLAPATRAAILGLALRAEDDAWDDVAGAPASSFTQALRRALDPSGSGPRLDPADRLDGSAVTSERPYTTTRIRTPEGPLDLALGAPEAIFALPNAPELDRWIADLATGTAAGRRIVGLASAPADGAWAVRALIGFADPVRPGIAEAIAEAAAAGIQAIVVTGDHPATAAAIAAEAGLPARGIVLGKEIASWDDARLLASLGDLHVVARSAPADKERIVRVARGAGRTVAVTGDGVNDAPALHGADVAVAMGSGTAVARDAADLVLGDDSFVTLMYGLREGRRIVDNVQKGLVFLVSTHVAFLGFILLATLAGFGQPLLPIQILWMELFIDASASFAFEREPAEPDVMARPPRRKGEALLSSAILARIGVAGAFTAVAATWLMVSHPGSADHARWLAYTALVAAQVVRAYANRRLAAPVLGLRPNWAILGGGIAVLLVQIAIPFIPEVNLAFRATPLELDDWLLVAIVALVPAAVAELIRMLRRTTWVA